MNNINKIQELCEECSEENRQYKRAELNQFKACFTIFKLAFAKRDSDAFRCAYETFEPQAVRWVYRHPDFPNTSEDATYFAHNAFVNMYLNINKHGFDRFSNVQALMAFLKTCVFSTVKQAIRDNRRTPYNIEDATDFKSDQPILSKNIEFMEIWKRIIDLIIDENDRLLIHYSFVLDMKPSEIAKKHPEIWSEARVVTLALFRIRKILRNDLILKETFGSRE